MCVIVPLYCGQELPENGADLHHFSPLHGKPVIGWMVPFGVTHQWGASWQPRMQVQDGKEVAGPIVDIHVHQHLGIGKLTLPFGTVGQWLTVRALSVLAVWAECGLSAG